MAKVKSSNKIKRSRGEEIFNVCNIIFLTLLMIVCLYPFWYVICASFSRSTLLISHTGALFKPVGFSMAAYKNVFENRSIWIGYGNTIFYVVVGTVVNIIMTVLGAYFLSRKNVPGQTIILMFIMFTMYFSGGMIPGFLNIQRDRKSTRLNSSHP